jgi:hypothetical protein
MPGVADDFTFAVDPAAFAERGSASRPTRGNRASYAGAGGASS